MVHVVQLWYEHAFIWEHQWKLMVSHRSCFTSPGSLHWCLFSIRHASAAWFNWLQYILACIIFHSWIQGPKLLPGVGRMENNWRIDFDYTCIYSVYICLSWTRCLTSGSYFICMHFFHLEFSLDKVKIWRNQVLWNRAQLFLHNKYTVFYYTACSSPVFQQNFLVTWVTQVTYCYVLASLILRRSSNVVRRALTSSSQKLRGQS